MITAPLVKRVWWYFFPPDPVATIGVITRVSVGPFPRGGAAPKYIPPAWRCRMGKKGCGCRKERTNER